jgi:hypothetical protein
VWSDTARDWLHSKIFELEQELARQTAPNSGASEQSSSSIRESIRDNYARLLFVDLEFAASKEVEQARATRRLPDAFAAEPKRRDALCRISGRHAFTAASRVSARR